MQQIVIFYVRYIKLQAYKFRRKIDPIMLELNDIYVIFKQKLTNYSIGTKRTGTTHLIFEQELWWEIISIIKQLWKYQSLTGTTICYPTTLDFSDQPESRHRFKKLETLLQSFQSFRKAPPDTRSLCLYHCQS